MSRSHTFEFEDAPPPRIPNLGPPLDVLGRRVRLLLLLLLDIVFYGVAYLQLTPPGFPLSFAAFTPPWVGASFYPAVMYAGSTDSANGLPLAGGQ